MPDDDSGTQTDPWDALCVDPHASFINDGRMEGAEAGRQSGYQMGYDLGRTTALDTGLELGFIRGIVSSLDTTTVSERAIRTIRELQELLDDFPTIDQVFREQERDRQGEKENVEQEDDSEQPAAVADGDARSIRIEMQRIRAKFKLLTVQLGCPHFSLKQLMDEAAAANEHESTAVTSSTTADKSSKAEQLSEW